MSDKLLNVIASVMHVTEDTLRANRDFESLSTYDSARQVELAMALEFEYGVKLNDDEMDGMLCVDDVRKLLASRGIANP